ncbi:hypothetical protein [Bacillus sp. MMSF_3328]|nr:hypothetical protein [Bacillus sp. MMSF_3328]
MSKEQFIDYLLENFDELTTSDLQGVIEARCIQTGEYEEEILQAVYKRVG